MNIILSRYGTDEREQEAGEESFSRSNQFLHHRPWRGLQRRFRGKTAATHWDASKEKDNAMKIHITPWHFGSRLRELLARTCDWISWHGSRPMRRPREQRMEPTGTILMKMIFVARKRRSWKVNLATVLFPFSSYFWAPPSFTKIQSSVS